MSFITDYLKGMIEELSNLLDAAKPVVFYQSGGFRISSVVVTTWIAMILIIVFVLFLTSKLEKTPTTRRQAIAEKITLFFYDFVYDTCGEAAKKVYSVLGSIFITILVMNFMWVVPIFTTPTSSYSTTFALAAIGFVYSQYVIIRETSLKGYLGSYVKPNAFMLIGNVTGFVAKPLSLSMRLFGNMFAGKILDTIIMITIPLLVPIVFSLLSILSGVIQAYVLTLLLTMYISEGILE